MQQADRLSKVFFFLFCLSIPIQLNKFFWTEFSYVQGIRVDYIAPAIYLSDFFIIAFISLSIIFRLKAFKDFLSNSIIVPLFLGSILISTLFAESLHASSYWSLKVIEMILLAWAIKDFAFTKKDIKFIVLILGFSALVQSFIAIGQFISQSSLGGMLYFLGEREFSVETLGIATFFSRGSEYLRSYGTFPHPNVLSLFLSVTLTIIVYYLLSARNIKKRLYILAILPIFTALLLTFSRTTILFFIISVFFILFRSKKVFIYSVLTLALLISIYFLIFYGRFFTAREIIQAANIRIELVFEGMKGFFSSFVFGVGLNNTFLSPSALPLFVRFQPVHNAYLHVLFQVGLLGFLPVFVFLLKVISRIRFSVKNKELWLFPIGISAVQILLTAGFDHYHVTLQQGMIMVALILGLLFNRSMERELD